MKEKIIKLVIPLGIAICWVLIFGMTVLIGNKILFDINTIATVVVAVAAFFVPYEKIGHLLTLDFLFEEYNEKTSQRTMRRIVLWGSMIMLTFLTGLMGEVRQCLVIVTLAVIYLFAYTSDIIEQSLTLCLIAQFLLIVNSFLCTFYKTDFQSLAIYMLAIMFTFYLFLLQSGRKYRLPCIIGFSALNCAELIAALYVLGRFEYFKRFFEYGQVYLCFEATESRFLSFEFTGDVNRLNHMAFPFSAVYYKLGTVPLIIFLLAFVVMMFLVIKSKKHLSHRRYMVLAFIFSMFAATYIHVLLANLQLMPSSILINMADQGQLIYISIVLRLFYTKKLPAVNQN